MYEGCLSEVSCIFQPSSILVILETVFFTGKYSLCFSVVPTGLWRFVPGRSKDSLHFERRISNVIIEILVLMCQVQKRLRSINVGSEL